MSRTHRVQLGSIDYAETSEEEEKELIGNIRNLIASMMADYVKKKSESET